ncbi:MAG TPA: enoyl-CoA hydratase-related protein, partial [Duganella sp.]|nr:enoyl-CoA hydratase-related protein [Duganella sp.]
MTAEYQVHGKVAVITLNNPPVNGMGHVTRSAAVKGIQQALADDAVKAIVITGAGKAFSGGADIKEFNTPKALQEPSLHTLIATAEGATKPVVAAIHSVCMGGGLELSLGCHYRVALPGAQIALPEVKLGLLPGAGGTQRLPRAIGLEAALNMIVSGEPQKATAFAGTALVDELVDADLVAAAVAFAQRVVAEGRPLRRLRDVKIDPAGADAFLQFARNSVKAAAQGLPAPLQCVECVAHAVTQPFDEGLRLERAAFFALMNTPESRALRHVFAAERAAGKIPDLPEGTPIRPIKKVGVIGAGTMGGGITMNFLNTGLPVVL